MNASQNIKISTALDYADGNADRNGAILDMTGYEGVLMIVKFATIAAGATTSIKAQQDTDPAGGTMADLEGTRIAVAADDDDQIFMIDLYRPTERYVRVVVDKDAANNAAENAIYVQYAAREMPVVQTVTDEVTYELHISPDEGTA